MSPSFSPSRPSHAASTALWMAGYFSGGIRVAGSLRVSRPIQMRHVSRRVFGFAAAPATIPSKSSGNRVASVSACRPPVEHPLKYERAISSPPVGPRCAPLLFARCKSLGQLLEVLLDSGSLHWDTVTRVLRHK